MDLSAIVTKEFIFASVPPASSNLYLPLSILFGLLILSAIALIIFLKGERKRLWGRYTTPFLLSGSLGFIHLGARYEQLPWLASRFFLILILTTLLAWIFALALTMTRFVPEYNKEQEVIARYNKYLPKKKVNRL